MLPPIGSMLLGNTELQSTTVASVEPRASSSFDAKLLTHQQVAGAAAGPKRAVDHSETTSASQAAPSQPDGQKPNREGTLNQTSAAATAVAEQVQQEGGDQSLPSELPPSGKRLPEPPAEGFGEVVQPAPPMAEQHSQHEHNQSGTGAFIADPAALGKYDPNVSDQPPGGLGRFQYSDLGTFNRNEIGDRLLLRPDSTYQGLELGMSKTQASSGDQLVRELPPTATSAAIVTTTATTTAAEAGDRNRLVQLGLSPSGSRLATDSASSTPSTLAPKLPSSAIAASKDPATAGSGLRADSGGVLPGLLASQSMKSPLAGNSLGSQVQTALDSRGLGAGVQAAPTSKPITPQELTASLAAARSLSEAIGPSANTILPSPLAGAMATDGRSVRALRDEVTSVKTGEALPAKYANRLDATAQSAAMLQAAPQLSLQVARQMLSAQANPSLSSVPNQSDASANQNSVADHTSGSNSSTSPLFGSFSSAGGLARGSGVESALPSGLVPVAQTNRLDVADGLNGAWVGRLSQMIAQQQITGQSLRIALSPAELGAVEITFNGASDNWSVSLSAQQGQTRELLDAHLDRIRSMLQDMGHRDAQVSLANRWTGAEAGANQQQYQDSQGRSSASGPWQHSPAVAAEESGRSNHASASSLSSSAQGVDAYV